MTTEHGSPLPYGAHHADLDGKVLAALERVAQSFRALQWQEARGHGLTPLQLQVLVHLLASPGGAYGSHLARALGVTRATVGEAVATLMQKGLVRGLRHTRDRRRIALALTPAGEAIATKVSAWGEAARAALEEMPREERATLLLFLMRFISALQKAGIVTVARMCVTCRFFRPDVAPGTPQPHYCALLEQPLAVESLRVDCPEHQPAVA